MKTRIYGTEGQSLLEAVRGNEHQLRAPCAGRGSCGKCRILVHTGPGSAMLTEVGDTERQQLHPGELEKGIRLAA